jgi:hypothetical protein
VDAPKHLHKLLQDRWGLALLRAHWRSSGTYRRPLPPRLHEKIKDLDSLIVEGLRPLEITGPETPWFYSNDDLNKLITAELLPLHEEWAGVPLEPTTTYGVRIYKNLSSLLMHVDRTDTHIISSIFHIDHKYDNASEPWPIEIEDYKVGSGV